MATVVFTAQIVIIAAVVALVPLEKGILLLKEYPNAAVQGRVDQIILVHRNQIEKSDQQPTHFRILHRLVFLFQSTQILSLDGALGLTELLALITNKCT